jgi:NAD(P)-dependent dehydrogenase (short-subunit alcohol dehydrogenase family)
VSRLVSVNYYGAVEVLDGLRPALAAGVAPAAVAISSNAIALTPLPDAALVDQLLEGPEAQAVATADDLDDGAAVYAMTKIALTRAVRRRVLAWGRAGVRLNAVAPGPFETAMLAGTRDDPVLGPLVDALPIPLERAGEAAEIAGVVAFLLGPDAAYVHGAVLFADGGTDALARPEAL